MKNVATASLMDLMEDIASMGRFDADYYQKMMHKIPPTKIVDRETFILAKCLKKRVVNFGSASGGLHDKIKKVATKVFGLDKVEPTDMLMDFDDEFCPLHGLPESDIYVCGEIIEHLANPGLFLKKIRASMKREAVKGCELLITVPNAFFSAHQAWSKQGIENVNDTHVSFYSWKTIDTLVRRYGFEPTALYYYNTDAGYKGLPVLSEGLVIVAS